MGLSVASAELSQSDPDKSSSATNIPIKWVAKRDRHMQLINSNVYHNNISDRNPIIQPATIQTNNVEKATIEQSPQGGYNPANQASLSASTNAIQRVPKSVISGPKSERESRFCLSLREDFVIWYVLLTSLRNHRCAKHEIQRPNLI